MKKINIIIIISFILLLSGCRKNFDTNSMMNISERKQKIIELVKKELINRKYICNELLDFNVEKVYLDGYYINDSNNKYFEIDFSYSCKDEKSDYVNNLNKNDSGNSIVWIYTNYDETYIYEIKNGISISYDDMNNGNYVRIGEVIK